MATPERCDDGTPVGTITNPDCVWTEEDERRMSVRDVPSPGNIAAEIEAAVQRNGGTLPEPPRLESCDEYDGE